jgi:ABC-type transporter Mla subunit MlaD
MPVQDLTPQLRTRLSRVERTVGWFVMIATLLLLGGFGYYVYKTAERKGWFLIKLPYHTYVQSATGLQVDDPVMMMGFNVGQITEIQAMPAFSPYGNVYIQFSVRQPYYGYIWTDSYVKLVSSGLLGNRSLEVVQGGTSGSTNLHPSYDIDKATAKVLSLWDVNASNWVAYTPPSKGYGFTNAQEAPVVTDQLQAIAEQVQKALPGILDLTNQIGHVLTNTATLTAHADEILSNAQPLLANFAVISSSLTNGAGSLGDWLIPTNINREIQLTLQSAHATFNTADTNVASLALQLGKSLENVANITSNLNVQVQRNDTILAQISDAVIHADQFVQGLKHHWLLRSAFKDENRAPPRSQSPAPPKTGKR